jgi:myo-inositol-1(or 4)-monophosphatase
MTRAEQQKILRIAVLAAKQAARIHMESYEKPHHIKSKRSLADVVTEVDVRSQKQIIKTIKRHFPSHDILAEEKGAPRSKSRVLWIVDPLDGTLNYSHGYPGFAVSIGVEVEGRLEVGVILHPPSGETFTVTRGGGAYLGRRRLQCSNISRLNLSLVTTGFSPKPDEAKRNIGFFVRAIGRVQAIRRGGSAALDLAYVAAGSRRR